MAKQSELLRSKEPQHRAPVKRRAIDWSPFISDFDRHLPFSPGPGPNSDVVWNSTPLGALLVPRGAMAAVLHGSKIYCAGGTQPGPQPQLVLDSVEAFDINTHVSMLMPSLAMPRPLAGAACVPVMGPFFVFGGAPGVGINALRSKSAYVCDFNTWQQLPDMLQVAFSPAGASAPDGVYAIGGCDGNGPFPLVQRLSMGNMQWSQATPLNIGRVGAAAVSANGHIFVFGGIDKPGYPVPSVEEYDPALKTWTVLPHTMPTPRYDLAAAVGSNGRVYTVGGMHDCEASNAVEEFDPVAKTWRVLAPMPTARYFNAVVATTDGRIVVLGGWTKIGGNYAATGVVEVGQLPTFP